MLLPVPAVVPIKSIRFMLIIFISMDSACQINPWPIERKKERKKERKRPIVLVLVSLDGSQMALMPMALMADFIRDCGLLSIMRIISDWISESA